jgi:cyclopropane-fatty-acyl-phospholipid synthase
VFFCGAYAGFGFHEDGVKAGFAAAAAALGSDWAPRPDARPLSLSLSERAARASCHSFLASFVRHGCMTLAEPGAEPRRIGPPAACAAAAAADAAAPAFGAGGGAADAEARYAAAEADPDALHVTLRIVRPAFYWKLATRADLGLAVRGFAYDCAIRRETDDAPLQDAYVDGDIEVQPSLMALLCLCIANRDAAAAQEHRDATSAAAAAAAAASSASALSAVAGAARAQLRRYGGMATAAVGLTGAYWRHLRRNNSVAQARRNIAAHYDLSNDMFRLFLSADMTYRRVFSLFSAFSALF